MQRIFRPPVKILGESYRPQLELFVGEVDFGDPQIKLQGFAIILLLFSLPSVIFFFLKLLGKLSQRNLKLSHDLCTFFVSWKTLL